MAKAEAGLLGQAGRTTVAKYLGWWMENVVRGEVAHRTYHNYLSQIRNHIVPRLGKKKLNTLELEDVEVMYRSMMTSGLSSATIRYVHAVLRRALKQAVVRGLVTRNVADGASLPRTGQREI
jgi:integrase